MNTQNISVSTKKFWAKNKKKKNYENEVLFITSKVSLLCTIFSQKTCVFNNNEFNFIKVVPFKEVNEVFKYNF